MAGKGTRDNSEGLNIGVRSFLIAIGIIFILMVATYVLTLVVPGGEYARIPDASGNMIIDAETGFHYTEGGIPLWKWILSPFLVLGAEGSGTIIAILIFLLVIGGVFNSLTACGMMNYMLGKIVDRFGSVKYRLMTVLVLFFMTLGSLVGSFEEVIPMTPIVVALSVALGWDAVTGVALQSGATIECDLLIVAVGVRANTSLARSAGICVQRGILTDSETMRTSDENIYAAGDCTLSTDMLDGEKKVLALYPNAVYAGTVAGSQMAGGNLRLAGVYAVNAIDFYGLRICTSGLINATGKAYSRRVQKSEKKYYVFKKYNLKK